MPAALTAGVAKAVVLAATHSKAVGSTEHMDCLACVSCLFCFAVGNCNFRQTCRIITSAEAVISYRQALKKVEKKKRHPQAGNVTKLMFRGTDGQNGAGQAARREKLI